MTRAAVVVALVLVALVLVGSAMEAAGDVAPGPVTGAGMALLVLVLAIQSWRRRPKASIGLILAVLPVLTRSLVAFFETARLWPHVPIIVLSSGVFGLGLLGAFLDRFQPPPDPPPTAL
jgi:hypothetical protein